MNTIIRPLTPDGLLGFNEFNQLCAWWRDNGSLCGTIVKDLRGVKCAICDKGWELSSESFRNEMRLDGFGSVHRDCWHRVQNITEYHECEGFMFSTRVKKIDREKHYDSYPPFHLTRIPNEYWGEGSLNGPDWIRINFRTKHNCVPDGKENERIRARRIDSPWECEKCGFLYTSSPVNVTIGRRKRVWEMTLNNATIPQALWESSPLSKIEDTKSFQPEKVLVHAWKSEQVRTYLQEMINMLVDRDLLLFDR